MKLKNIQFNNAKHTHSLLNKFDPHHVGGGRTRKSTNGNWLAYYQVIPPIGRYLIYSLIPSGRYIAIIRVRNSVGNPQCYLTTIILVSTARGPSVSTIRSSPEDLTLFMNYFPRKKITIKAAKCSKSCGQCTCFQRSTSMTCLIKITSNQTLHSLKQHLLDERVSSYPFSSFL